MNPSFIKTYFLKYVDRKIEEERFLDKENAEI